MGSGTAAVAPGEIGVYPIGALSIAFHEILGADHIIGRKNSKTTDWVMQDGVLRIDGAARDIRVKLRRGFSGPGQPLPELVVVSPWADQLPDFLDELLEYFELIDEPAARALANVPTFLLTSSGIYFEDFMAAARRRVETSGLRDKEFFLGALARRIFRAVAYQAALRRGRGRDADYFCVRGAAYVVLSLNGEAEDRERVCALMKGRGYDISVEPRFLQSEYDKSILNATVSAFSQAFCGHDGRLLALRCGDFIAGHPGLPGGFSPRLSPDVFAGPLRAVGEAFVAVAKAKGVYPADTTFEAKFARSVESFLLKVANHPPSSVQLLMDRMRDPEWTGDRLLPTEEHIIRPMIRYALESGDARGAAAFRDLEARILASYRRVLELRAGVEPVLERLARGERLDPLEAAVLRYRVRRDIREGYGAALALSENEAEPFADRLRDSYAAAAAALPAVPPAELWSRYLPLALHVAGKKTRGAAFVTGIHGLPGAGKTTLAKILAALLSALRPEARVVRLSIDDFYFNNQERLRRGLGWAVGAHDLTRAHILGDLKRAATGDEVAVPRFDKKARDMSAAPDVVRGPVDFVVFEGFGVGLRGNGYDALSKHVDLAISLRAAEDVCKKWRGEAGWADRQEAHGGSKESFEREFEELWAGVRGQFAPVCSEVDGLADLLLDLGPGHRVERMTRRA